MRVDAFLKLPTIDGGTSDEIADGKAIELLSFEHCVERAPVRQVFDLANYFRSEANELALDPMAIPEAIELFRQHSAKPLADNLIHYGFAVFKCVDATTPKLHAWAAKQNELIETAKILVRLPIKSGDEVEHKTALTIVLKNVYIAKIEIVGRFPAQPWLENAREFPINSTFPLDVGPVERVEFNYREIQWTYGAQQEGPTFKVAQRDRTN